MGSSCRWSLLRLRGAAPTLPILPDHQALTYCDIRSGGARVAQPGDGFLEQGGPSSDVVPSLDAKGGVALDGRLMPSFIREIQFLDFD